MEEEDVEGGSKYMQVEVVTMSHSAMAPPTLIIVVVGDDDVIVLNSLPQTITKPSPTRVPANRDRHNGDDNNEE